MIIYWSIAEERPKNVNEMSNPEFAALIEKKHLKECEDSDYMILEKLLQTRCSVDESDDMFDDVHDDYGPRKMLRRETAIELPITPSKSNIVSLADSVLGNEEFTVKNERQTVSNRNSLRDSKNSPVSLSSQNSPRNSQYLQSTYLNPASFEGCHRIYKKSCESLQKNSSTDTDYSMQPYKFIKQSSNETNSSLNIDNSSITNDLSMDGETSMNSTVIEMLAGANVAPDERIGFTKRTSSLGSASLAQPSDQRPGFIKKQFSIDKSAGSMKASGSIPEGLEQPTPSATLAPTTAGSSSSGSKTAKSNRFSDNLSLLGTKTMMALLKESSSTSTEDTQTASYREAIPCISTNLVQDEIAKLSSNIKNSMEEETGPPFNETMC